MLGNSYRYVQDMLNQKGSLQETNSRAHRTARKITIACRVDERRVRETISGTDHQEGVHF